MLFVFVKKMKPRRSCCRGYVLGCGGKFKDWPNNFGEHGVSYRPVTEAYYA